MILALFRQFWLPADSKIVTPALNVHFEPALGLGAGSKIVPALNVHFEPAFGSCHIKDATSNCLLPVPPSRLEGKKG